ncbi:hypothetical protein SBX64_10485 [Vibrio rhizosphaerae]|uniref:Putative adhesin Stv domain-containing protein n=1 Tax=Vibrio rhizosphaerae TaxID=398736 RepID=A0ABU4IW89_9VIBR|nr:hypothetical protein [Vibrio rhizosphaerae]MDW6092976.1 hypothetical protein [Vibrio rhizosphaerae]
MKTAYCTNENCVLFNKPQNVEKPGKCSECEKSQSLKPKGQARVYNTQEAKGSTSTNFSTVSEFQLDKTPSNVLRIYVVGHGTWTSGDDSITVPDNYEVYFHVPDNQLHSAAGQRQWNFKRGKDSVNAGQLTKNYRLWPLWGSEVLILPEEASRRLDLSTLSQDTYTINSKFHLEAGKSYVFYLSGNATFDNSKNELFPHTEVLCNMKPEENNKRFYTMSLLQIKMLIHSLINQRPKIVSPMRKQLPEDLKVEIIWCACREHISQDNGSFMNSKRDLGAKIERIELDRGTVPIYI